MFEGLTKKFRAKKIPECRVCGTRGRDASPSVGRGGSRGRLFEKKNKNPPVPP
jgi:hypothetical protein